MISPSIRIISDCFVKPKFVSEDAKKPIYLSPWDLAMMSTHYIQKGLLFRWPEIQDFSITTFLNDLKDSLSTTLTHFHPLAARLATLKQPNPPSFVVFINPENSPGAKFIHSAANLTVADIITPIDVPLIVKSFFDLNGAISHDGHKLPLLSIQVTELIDGIFIACSANHMVVDGSSYWHFFNSWSEVFHSKRRNDSLVSISRPPAVLQRWVPTGSDPMYKLPFTHEDQFIVRPNPKVLRERIFHFSSDALSRLKAKVNSECDTTKISTLQSLSALVWRCVTRARRLTPERETACRMAADNRKRLSPPLPETYFGNSLHSVRAIATTGELLDRGIGWAGWRLHQEVVNHDDKLIKDFVGSWLKSPFVYTSRFFYPNCIQIVSSPRFDMYGNKFGLGKGLAVRSGYANKFDGKVTVYPGQEDRGSMDLEICLSPQNMKAFECDEEFMSVVTW